MDFYNKIISSVLYMKKKSLLVYSIVRISIVFFFF